MFKNEVERRKINKTTQQKQYYEELKKGIEDKKRNQNLEKMMHDNDTHVMQHKKQETDFIHQGLRDRQKEEKYMLGQIYQNQISQTKQLRDSEKQAEKELERMQIDRMKGVNPDAFNSLKKKAYQQEFKHDLDQKNKLKQYDAMMREQSVRENRKLMDDYARKQISNELEYQNKFQKYDKNMEKRMHDYNQYVMKPKIQKDANMTMIERKNIDDYNKKQEINEKYQQDMHKMQVMETSKEIKNQMNEKSKLKQLDSQIGLLENERTTNRAFEITSFDQMLKDDKKKRQDMYRQMLQSQIQYNNGLKSFGNMTQVEKNMNKDDLKAYKRYDNNQYGMIPGLNADKKYPKPQHQGKQKKEPAFEEQQRRLEAYGYGRYLKKVPRNQPIENFNNKLGESRSNQNLGEINRSYSGNYQDSFNHSPDQGARIPNSRRHTNTGASPRSPNPTTLRNAGAVSMSRDIQRTAGSPSGGMGNPYRRQVL